MKEFVFRLTEDQLGLITQAIDKSAQGIQAALKLVPLFVELERQAASQSEIIANLQFRQNDAGPCGPGLDYHKP